MDANEVLATDLDALSGSALSEFLVEADALVSAARTKLRHAVNRWDAEMAWADDGAASGPQWMSARLGMRRGVARAVVRTARRARSMPIVDDLASNGELCEAKVEVFARVVDPDDKVIAEAFEADEEMLVTHAQNLTVDQTIYMLKRWRCAVDPDGSAADANRLHANRYLFISQTFNGGYKLDGMLDPEAGAIVKNGIDRLMDEDYRDRAGAEPDAEVAGAAQRRADAMTEMARRAGCVEGSETAKPPAPLVVVTADVETLEGRASKPCELDAGGEITPEAARRTACDANVARVITDPDGTPLEAGRTIRVPSAPMRRAIALRDRGCTFPGCDRPPNWCHAHHLVHWIHGGATDQQNLTLLCSHHHHLVHEGGYGAARDPAGRLHFTRPNGSEIEARPAA